MTRLVEALLLIITALGLRIAYVLCFTDSPTGGYLVAFWISAAPFATFLMGKAHSTMQTDDETLFKSRVEARIRSEFRSQP